VVGGLACSNDPRSYAGWSTVLLVGSPMPDWSCGEEPDEEHPPANGARGIEISPYPVGSPGYTNGPTPASGARGIEIGPYPVVGPGYTNRPTGSLVEESLSREGG
jgi:hypothetical protein